MKKALDRPHGEARPLAWLAERFELSRGDGASNVRPMEGLRGFAVFLVFLVHYVTLVEPYLAPGSGVVPVAEALHTIGNSGVDLFFVLSGFLIYGSLIERAQPFVPYMARRVRRIYPAFTAVFALYVALSFVFPAESKIPAGPAAAASYLAQNFLLLPGLFAIEPLITVAWSLSYEMFYYLAIPLVIAVFGLADRSRRWRLRFFLATALGLILHGAAFGGHVRLSMFISGILLHEILQGGGIKPLLRSGTVAGIALALGLAGMLLPIGGTPGAAVKTSILFVAFLLLCLACFSHPDGGVGKLFSWMPVRWLGNMSYSYYLLHGLSLKAAFMVLPRVLATEPYGAGLFWILMPVMFVVTLLPTAGLFLLVERPFSLTKSRRLATVSAAASSKI